MATPENQFKIRCSLAVALGLGILALAIAGMLGVPVLSYLYPILLLVTLFVAGPGLVGLYRGLGKPSDYVIPRPKQRTRTSAATRAGAATRASAASRNPSGAQS